jgi:hypothetical protein
LHYDKLGNEKTPLMGGVLGMGLFLKHYFIGEFLPALLLYQVGSSLHHPVPPFRPPEGGKLLGFRLRFARL